jgi:hypothetical protein
MDAMCRKEGSGKFKKAFFFNFNNLFFLRFLPRRRYRNIPPTGMVKMANNQAKLFEGLAPCKRILTIMESAISI